MPVLLDETHNRLGIAWQVLHVQLDPALLGTSVPEAISIHANSVATVTTASANAVTGIDNASTASPMSTALQTATRRTTTACEPRAWAERW